MSEIALAISSRRESGTLPRRVAAAMSRIRGHQYRGGQVFDRPGEKFPSAVGATDRELVRLHRWNDPEEVLRQAQTEMEVWRGRI